MMTLASVEDRSMHQCDHQCDNPLDHNMDYFTFLSFLPIVLIT